jgi:hypothetical protein
MTPCDGTGLRMRMIGVRRKVTVCRCRPRHIVARSRCAIHKTGSEQIRVISQHRGKLVVCVEPWHANPGAHDLLPNPALQTQWSWPLALISGQLVSELASHGMQLSESDAPVSGRYLPVPQSLHVLSEMACSAVEYLPLSQSTHCVPRSPCWSLYFPL